MVFIYTIISTSCCWSLITPKSCDTAAQLPNQAPYSQSAEICRGLKKKFVEPKSTSLQHVQCIETLGKCIVMVPIYSGMGATNLKFWVLG